MTPTLIDQWLIIIPIYQRGQQAFLAAPWTLGELEKWGVWRVITQQVWVVARCKESHCKYSKFWGFLLYLLGPLIVRGQVKDVHALSVRIKCRALTVWWAICKSGSLCRTWWVSVHFAGAWNWFQFFKICLRGFDFFGVKRPCYSLRIDLVTLRETLMWSCKFVISLLIA
jgi:hypothetical protein